LAFPTKTLYDDDDDDDDDDDINNNKDLFTCWFIRSVVSYRIVKNTVMYT